MAIVKDGVLIKAEDIDIINGVFTATSDVKVIGPKAFLGASNLVGVNLPGNVIGIGKEAFASCEKIEFVTATNNMLVIGESAFEFCPRLLAFLVDEKDEYKEKEPFCCTGGQFIKLFGYYEKFTEGFKTTWQLEQRVSDKNNFDWFGTTEASSKYPLFAGIYFKAFFGCNGITEFQIPNKMNIFGEDFASFIDLNPYAVKDFKNITEFYRKEAVPDYSNRGFIIKKVNANADDVKNRLIKELEVQQEKKPEVEKNEEVLSYEIPKRRTLFGNLFSSKKTISITVPQKAIADSTIPATSPVSSEEKLESLLESKILMLESTEPDIAKHFQTQLDELNANNLYVGSRCAKLSSMCESFSKILSIIQTKIIKDLFENSSVDESDFKKYADIILESRDNLKSLKSALNNEKIYKSLKVVLYSTIYLMIKKELAFFGSNELFDKMSDVDRIILLSNYARDIAQNEGLVTASLSKKEVDLDMIKKYFAASGIKINYRALPTGPVKLYRIVGEQLIKIENGLAVAQSFSI